MMKNDPPSSTPKIGGQSAAAKTAMSSEDAEKARALAEESMERQRLYLENASKLLDKILKVHENGASFYEKLILFDVGTIALSLTLLGQIVAHTPGGHVPRHPFIWFLCPAWFLLLVSIQSCALRSLLTRLSAVIGGTALSEGQAQQLRFANSPQGGNPQHKAQTVSEVLSNMNEVLVRATKDQTSEINALLQTEAQSNKRARIAARIGMFATILALLLICIFAIKSILAL